MTTATRPLKRYCVGPPEYGLNVSAGDYSDDGVRFIRTTDIGPQGGLTEGRGVFVPEEFALDPRHQLVPGDLLFSRAGSLGRCLRFEAQHGPATFAGYLVRFRPGPQADPRFLEYCAQSKSFQSAIEADAITSTISNFNAERYASIEIPDAPLTEQRAIADYLDAETAHIDALIAKKQQLIRLIDERLRCMAVDLVAGNSDGERTGIPTIPLVPSDWRVLRNKVFMREARSLSETGEEEMLSVSHLTGVTARSEKTVYMFEAESTVGYKLVRSGDLVVNTMWAWMGAAGVSPASGIVSPAYGVYRIDPAVVYPPWIDLLIRTEPYIVEMTRFSRGVTSSRLRLYPDEFLRLATPVPPLAQQRKMVDRYREARSVASSAATALAQQVDLLTEHRQALITAAVTGGFRGVPGAL